MRPVRVALLALLDEEGVLHHPRGVEEDLDAARLAPRSKLADVGHRHRLAAGHVHRARERHVRDLRRADLGDEALQLGEVDVALERRQGLRVVGLVDDHVVEGCPRQLLVEPRRREVHVPGDVVAGLDQGLADQVLRPAALVRRDEVPVAVEAPDGLLEVVVVAAPRVRLVAEHHPGPLAVAHGRRPRVGQEVDVDVVAVQEERVVAGLGQGAPRARLARGHRQRLDHLDLPRLGPAAAAVLLAHRVERFVRHRVRLLERSGRRAATSGTPGTLRSVRLRSGRITGPAVAGEAPARAAAPRARDRQVGRAPRRRR